jgi:hypothetical protein
MTSEEHSLIHLAGYTGPEQAAPGDKGQGALTEQAPPTTVNEEQAQDGTITRAGDSHQPELTESVPTLAGPHQSQQQQQTTDDQPPFDLSEFVGFEEPPLDDDDDNWDDDDTARVANTTADTFTPLAHSEVAAPNIDGEGQEGQEQYTDSHQFPEGEGVNAEYGEYDEGEWGAEEGHEEDEGVPVEQTEAPAAGDVLSQGQTGTVEAGMSFDHILDEERFSGLQVTKSLNMKAKSTSVQSMSMSITKVKMLKAKLENGPEVRFPLFLNGTLPV